MPTCTSVGSVPGDGTGPMAPRPPVVVPAAKTTSVGVLQAAIASPPGLAATTGGVGSEPASARPAAGLKVPPAGRRLARLPPAASWATATVLPAASAATAGAASAPGTDTTGVQPGAATAAGAAASAPRHAAAMAHAHRRALLVSPRTGASLPGALLRQTRPGVELQALVLGELIPGGARRLGQLLGALDRRAEALGRRAQRELGIDLELAGDVDRGEEQVADRRKARVAVLAGLRQRLRLAADGVHGVLRAG